MEITVQRLRDTLSLVAPVVPKKTSLPVCIYVRLGDGALEANNLEQHVRVGLPEASDPPFLLPHRRALDFLKAVPGDTLVKLEAEGRQVAVTARNLRLRLEVADAEEFPPAPSGEYTGEARVDGDALVGTLAELATYTATEDTRPVLTGVCLTLGDPAEACGADGFRLAYRPLPFALPPVEGVERLIVPRQTVKALAKLWGAAEKVPEVTPGDSLVRLVTARRPVRLRYGGEKTLEVSFGQVTLVSHLIEGTFPDYHPLIPEGGASRVTVMGEALERALRQVGEVAGNGLIRMQWGDNALTLITREEEVGEMEVQVPAATEGEPGRIAFNQGYLSEYLRGRHGTVTLQVDSPSSPGLFTAPGAPQVVVMPMFVQWGDEAPEQPQTEAAEGETPTEEAAGRAEASQEEPEVTQEGPPAGEDQGQAPRKRRRRRK